MALLIRGQPVLGRAGEKEAREGRACREDSCLQSQRSGGGRKSWRLGLQSEMVSQWKRKGGRQRWGMQGEHKRVSETKGAWLQQSSRRPVHILWRQAVQPLALGQLPACVVMVSLHLACALKSGSDFTGSSALPASPLA